MRRLSVLFAVSCILIALLAVPAYASVVPYQFDVMPSVAVLPSFDFSEDTESMMLMYPGYLPEGEYAVFLDIPSWQQYFFFENSVVIAYDTSGTVSSYPFCVVENLSHPDWGAQVYNAHLFYVAEDDATYLQLYWADDGSQAAFASDSVLTLLRVNVKDDDAASAGYLKSYLVDLFGPYEQQTETVTQKLADGSTVTVEQRIPGIAGLDYEWIAAVCLFGLMLYCFFRLLGGVSK